MEASPIWQPETQQRVLRAILDAITYPGSFATLPAQIEQRGPARSVLATLVKGRYSLADPHGLLDAGDWTLMRA